MSPLIKAESYVWIEEMSPEGLRCGDMVLYKINESKFIHRIKSIRDGKIIVNDDTGVIQEQIIDIENVLGRVNSLFNGYTGLIYNKLALGLRKILNNAQ